MNSRSRGRAGFGSVVFGLLGALQLGCGKPSNDPAETREPAAGSGGESTAGGSGGTAGTGGSGATGGTGGSGGLITDQGGGGGEGGSEDDGGGATGPTPPPLSGGTLIALPDNLAVLSDPDRDRIVTVDVTALEKVAEITLEPGSEPARLVADNEGRVHVALRGTGEVVSVDPLAGEILERRSVCQAPRGVAFDASNDAVVIACLEGTLVELPAAGGEPIRTTMLEPDLRDVVFLGDTLVVTRFRSAELLYLDAERSLTQRQRPLADVTGFAATTAWRAVATPSGELVVAHHRAPTSTVSLEPSCPGPGSEPFPCLEYTYGFRGACGGPIVQATTTTANADGIVATYSSIPNLALPVDVAVSPEGVLVIANGAYDPSLSYSSPGSDFAHSFVYETRERPGSPADCAPDAVGYESYGAITSVAFASDGHLLALTREPSELAVYQIDGPDLIGVRQEGAVQLGGKIVTDLGHHLFHTDTRHGISCASCHAEGSDDGHVWTFPGIESGRSAMRRTQPLDVALQGSAPFNWGGEHASFNDLLNEVFVRRMGGFFQSDEERAALSNFVYGLKRRPPVRSVSDEAAARGKELFLSEEVGCASCHSGPRLSNGETEDVGKDAPMQVPSLIGVSVRAPFMHDGCAATLFDTFDPACGGTSHGHPELLDEAGLADLIAYLETL